jgi:DNA-binding PadR family transcriptional regulator
MATQRATLKHAVLGLVLERPSYGYELMNRLDQRAPYWRGNGVYNVLDRLEEEEFVVGGGGRGAGSQRSAPKTVYHGTAVGLAFFHKWLLEPTQFTPPRQDLDLKISLSGPDEWPALIEQIAGQEIYCMNELKGLTYVPAHLLPVNSRLDWPEASTALQRNAQIKMLQVRIEWLQEVRATMRLLLERRPKAL